jgi:O-antigen biosynthesis protein
MVSSSADIVLPVYNGLAYVKDCIESLLDCSPPALYRLYLVDDCSDSFTQAYLEQQAVLWPQITLHRSPENRGFVKACNWGISLGSAPYVVLVNSDVIVTPGWLERLMACAESDTRIASVNPLTNYAAQIAVPLAPGANFYGMDRVLQERFSAYYPDVVTGVGFCLLLRRAALEKVGCFDEIYGHGYGEDSDLCMRLTTQGYRTVVAANVYVYHKGQGTFRDRGVRYRHNRKLFDARWRKEYGCQLRDFRKVDPLKPVRDLFQLPRRWDPNPVIWETGRALLASWHARHWREIGHAAVRGLWQLPQARREVATAESVAAVARPERLRITYVLHDLVVAGGVLSVIQLVNELIRLGVEARIVALMEDPAIYQWTRLFTCPLIFRNPQELIARFPPSDIAVATLWDTAPWVADLVKSGRSRTGAYFLQGYEVWFFSETEQAARQRVRESYRLIEHKIVKSDWLQEKLAAEGFAAKKILLGMDLAVFYPRTVKSSALTVLAIARPRPPWRGFQPTIAALARVKQVLPEVKIILFGDRFLSSQKIPFPYCDAGVVTDQNQLAELYSAADVFLDGSDFQGFGRCALEAMACGTACVLTSVGGVNEYARGGENCLLVPPQRPEAFAEAMIKILKDKELKTRLVENGFKTAGNFCHKREARETLAYFQELIDCHPQKE